MNRPSAALLLLLLLPLAACRSGSVLTMSTSGTVLRRVAGAQADEGTVYKALPGRFGAPQIQRTVTRRVQEPVLGLRASDLEAELAASLGAPPWRGVLVERVEPDSAARAAGLRVGDVLVEVAGERVHSRNHLDELVRTRLQAGSAVTVAVERWANSSDANARERVELTLVPDGREVLDDYSESFQLETASGVQRLTGLQVGAVPADLSAEIWERERPTLLITGVVAGSPAYAAGLRSGDRLLSVDERPAEDLEVLVEAVAARARAKDIRLLAGELPRDHDALATGSAERIALEVTGPLGPHEARVAVRADLDEAVEFSVPILFDYEGNVSHTRWSFLDFILQFGANYRATTVTSETRDPAVHSELSLLPFGMFEFERSPHSRETTLFWFVSWESRR